MMWIDLVGIALFANFITGWFDPINKIRIRIVEKLINTIVKYNMLWAQPVISMFTCPMCIAFWGSLLYTKNLSYALITSFSALLFDLIITLYSYVKSELN
jgi:hypothetical protein